MDKVQSVLGAWQKYLVEPAAKNDPLSFVVVAVASKESEAREIVNTVISGIRNYVLQLSTMRQHCGSARRARH